MPLALTTPADQTTTLNTPVGPIAITLTDITGTAVLTATASTASGPFAATFAFGGGGPDRTLTITPPTGVSGQIATVYLTVTDDAGTATANFLLTVTASAAFTVPETWTPQEVAPRLTHDSQGVKEIMTFLAPYPACRTARPKPGGTMAGYPGRIVKLVEIEPKRADEAEGIALVTVTFSSDEEANDGGGSGSDNELAKPRFHRRWENIQKPLLTAKIYMPGGSKALTDVDLAHLDAWKNEPTAALKGAFKYRLNGKTHTLSPNAQHAATKILRGVENYDYAVCVVSRIGLTRKALAAATGMNKVFKTRPPGFPTNAFPPNLSWRGIEDDLEQLGVVGPAEGTLSYQGADSHDPDLYEEGHA